MIEALDTDPDLRGKIAYRCLTRGGDYYHLATVTDDEAVSTLQSKDFFKHYSRLMRLAGGAEVDAGPIEIIAKPERGCEAGAELNRFGEPMVPPR